mgnify:FL=1
MVRVDKEEGRKGKQSKAKQSNNTNIFQVFFFLLHERHNDDAHIHYMIIKSSLVSVYHLTQLETTIPKNLQVFQSKPDLANIDKEVKG